MAKTISELISDALIIKNETSQGANTANRIGSMNEEIIKYLQGINAGNFVDVRQDNYVATIGTAVDATKIYVITELIDVADVSIKLNSVRNVIWGFNHDLCGFTSSSTSFTLFDNSSTGELYLSTLKFSISGNSSKVFNVGFQGTEYLEAVSCEFSGNTKIGTIANGQNFKFEDCSFEEGAFDLTLDGTWSEYCNIENCRVYDLDGYVTTSMAFLNEGSTLSFTKGLKLNNNFIDLHLLGTLSDLEDTKFTKADSYILYNNEFYRQGVSDPSDTAIIVGVGATNIKSRFKNNKGIKNTYVGGQMFITSAIETVIAAVNTPTVIAGTWAGNKLEHFTQVNNYQLRFDGTDPYEFRISGSFVLEGTANDEYEIILMKHNGADEVVASVTRTIDSLSGGRDVAYFNGDVLFELKQGDYIWFEVQNLSDSDNCTLEFGSGFTISER